MRFPYAHAAHAQWPEAAASVLAQLRGQTSADAAGPERYAPAPTLALLYVTDHYAAQAQEILDHLSAELPGVTDWAGSVGVGISSNNVEYFDQPAMALMLCNLPSNQYRVFSGVAPLGMGFEAHTALIHADASTPDLPELIDEMAQRTSTAYLFGGLASSRGRSVQFALAADGNVKGQGRAGGVFSGGLSGVAFGSEVDLVSRVTQGCQPLGGGRAAMHEITGADRNLVTELDGEPALDVLLRDLNVSLNDRQEALTAVRSTLVGLGHARPGDGSHLIARPGNFGTQVVVRHIIGLDPARRGVAIADLPETGMQLAFCQRNVKAARADLIRICSEVREELDAPEPVLIAQHTEVGQGPADHKRRVIAGAVYVSCAGRGGPHFGQAHGEMQIVRQALGDVPLVGFFAGGEIAGHQLFGYTGVLTVFASNTEN